MLKAKDFIEIDIKYPTDEKMRLEALYGQINKQSLKIRQQLSDEFLEIVTNQDKNIQSRVLACNILGGYQDELNFDKMTVASKLQEVLWNEFIVFRRSDKVFAHENLYLLKTDPMKACFLQILLATLLRIDFENMNQIVEKILDNMENNQLKESLMALMIKEKHNRGAHPGK